MIRLITIQNPRMGQAFIDYMASRKIDVQMMPEGSGQFALWLIHSEDQVEAEAELKQFLTEPNHPKYQPLLGTWLRRDRINSIIKHPALCHCLRQKPAWRL